MGEIRGTTSAEERRAEAEQFMVEAVLVGSGVIAFVIGVIIYIVQLRQGLHADASRKWPTAAGTVTTSVLEKSPGARWRYRVSLQYTYRVGGTDFLSNRIFWGGNEGRENHMASVADTYRAGGKVRVYYDPHNPAQAVLDPAQNTGSRATALYAIAMMTLGLFSFTGGVYSLFH